MRFEARRAAGISEPEQRWRAVAEYCDFMIRQLDDARQIEGYRAQGVAVYKGAARIRSAPTVVWSASGLCPARLSSTAMNRAKRGGEHCTKGNGNGRVALENARGSRSAA